jgi:hypothetical protein
MEGGNQEENLGGRRFSRNDRRDFATQAKVIPDSIRNLVSSCEDQVLNPANTLEGEIGRAGKFSPSRNDKESRAGDRTDLILMRSFGSPPCGLAGAGQITEYRLVRYRLSVNGDLIILKRSPWSGSSPSAGTERPERDPWLFCFVRRFSMDYRP